MTILDSCLVLVAHNRSPSVQQILQHLGEDTAHSLTGTHLLVLQKVGLTKRQIIAVWLSGIQYSRCSPYRYIFNKNYMYFLSPGDDLKPEDAIRHIAVNLQNIKAISLQRYAFYKLHIRPPSISFSPHWVYGCMTPFFMCVKQ